MSRVLKPIAIFSLIGSILAGCTVGPQFRSPKQNVPSGYLSGADDHLGDAGKGETAQRMAIGRSLRADWWKLLQSPSLDHLIDRAIANNWTLASARAHLEKARDGIAASRGGLFPQIDGVASIGREKYGAAFLGPQAFTFPPFSAYAAGLNVGYDIDLFGRTRRKIEKAGAEAEMEQWRFSAAALALTGNVTLQAVQIAAVNAQIDVVHQIIQSDQKNLDLVRQARAFGGVTDIDVLSAQSQIDRDRTLLPPLRQQLAIAEDALTALLGEAPQQSSMPDFALSDFTLPSDLPVAVPSRLVRGRPDILAAEARLHAASATVGIATANLYPDINLSASIAEQGLVNGPAGAAWSLLGGITAPIFHGGTLAAQKREADADYKASFADYEQIVVDSFRQVADQLHALKNDSDALATQNQACASAQASLRLTRLGYGVGNAGFVQVVDAQRLVQQAELGRIQATAQRLIDTTKLFLAMGGRWTESPAPADAKSPDRVAQ